MPIQNRSSLRTRSTQAGKPAPPARPSWLIPSLLLLATIATLWRVCTNEFTDWDDDVNVTQNPHLNPPTLDGLLYFVGHPYEKLYVPLSYAAWWLLAQVARVDAPDARGIWLDPYVFHAANLLLHALSSLVCFQLLQRLSGLRWPSFAGALLFAIHPLQVEAVAWVTGMKDLLCGLLSLVALWQYVLFAAPAPEPGPDRSTRTQSLHYVLATIALIAALLAKPSAITVPLLALVLDRLLLRRSWREIAISLAPWGLIVLAFAVIGMLAQRAPGSHAGPIAARPLVAADSLAFYLCKIALPLKLGVLYDYSPRTILHHLWGRLAWALPAALLLTAWASRRSAPWILAALAVLFLAPLPVLGLIPFEFEQFSTVADRYLYVAMLGPALALTFLLRSARSRKFAAIACGVWLAVLGTRSYAQTRVWRDTATLFENAISVNPNSAAAYANLANDAMASNRVADAVNFARHSVALEPGQVSAYLILGSALRLQGQPHEEENAYRQACQNDPHDPAALADLASAVAEDPAIDKATRLHEAADLCARAITIAPASPSAHLVYGAVLNARNDLPNAIVETQTAVRLNPNDVQGHLALARRLAQAGRRDEAANQFSIALRLDPSSPAARDGLDQLTQKAH